jgi:hypothetical protein
LAEDHHTKPAYRGKSPVDPANDVASYSDEAEAIAKWGSGIFPHRDLLIASGITPAVARERGYVSADTKKALEQRGFSLAQRRLLPWSCLCGT